MINILLLTPLTGNGGIASWSRKFINTFESDKYRVIPIDRSVKGRAFEDKRVWSRIWAGLKEMIVIRKKVKNAIRAAHIDILHTTTSGSFGTFRDYFMAQICCNAGVKRIMHCRYGCIPEDLQKPLYGWFLRETMRRFDQIWVLDNSSAKAIRKFPDLANKVYVTPNSIEVPVFAEIPSKQYTHVAFIANLMPTKGLFELLEAFIKLDDQDMQLSIVGKGEDAVVKKIKQQSGDRLDKTIHLLGQLPNDKAVEFMKSIDILALPTYMQYEAFPISILEAMSLGKLVISTHRAAIGDMLTSLDGTPCGVFVAEKSVDDLVAALAWCRNNKTDADRLCTKAYEKVYHKYRMEVIYELYASLYDKLC